MSGVDEASSLGHVTNPKVLAGWYVVCRSADLRRGPMTTMLHDVPLVLFRTSSGAPTALLDRCAHRNVPLSQGRIVESTIECGYHGWRYDAGGVCQVVPGLCGESQAKARRVLAYHTRDTQGFIWVYGQARDEVEKALLPDPPVLKHVGDRQYRTFNYSADFEATLHATAENILDVPHTAFLHRGLFRRSTQQVIRARVRRFDNTVETEFFGESRPTGLMGRLLAPGGGEIRHIDRFVLPSLAQVEYALGNSHLVIHNLLTPISEFKTRLFTVVCLRWRGPAQAVMRLLKPLALKVVAQDAAMLAHQTANIRRFGREQFVSTPIDVMGPHILRLLRRAERGESPVSSEVVSEELELRV
ncbi:MAG: Rieske 2Fe-2S domain-containing protein [Myxococcota bacterium]